MTSATRDLFAGRYELTERIATGGMGVVWRARDRRLDRDVAIKLIRPEYSDDPTFRQRLRLEARATAAIRSPHVVRLHDVCETPDPEGGYEAFIVMELVDGLPLSAVLRDGPLPVALTTAVIEQTASALAAAHERGIVHRDIKPANLMLDEHGRVTVLDFGIARAADAVALTATDLILGTARYISPEQADGRGATTASDVYSLGIVAYECLSGAVPFDASSDVAVALAHLREPVPPLPETVPGALADLVTRMLAKAPDDRPSAAEVAAALGTEAAAQTAPISVAAPAPAPDTGGITRAIHLTRTMATRVMTGGVRLRDYDYRDSGSAPLRPAVVLPGAAAAVLLLVIAAVVGGPTRTPAAAASQTTVTQTAATQTHTVLIDPLRYLGHNWSTVRSELRARGVVPAAHFAGHGPVAKVVGLAPTGRVERGSKIIVEVARTGASAKHARHAGPARGPAPHAGPPAPPAGGPAGHVPPGQAKKHP